MNVKMDHMTVAFIPVLIIMAVSDVWRERIKFRIHFIISTKKHNQADNYEEDFSTVILN